MLHNQVIPNTPHITFNTSPWTLTQISWAITLSPSCGLDIQTFPPLYLNYLLPWQTLEGKAIFYQNLCMTVWLKKLDKNLLTQTFCFYNFILKLDKGSSTH